jgi:tetratricopeptide (TPR) repeat protein
LPLFKKAVQLSPIPQTIWLLNMASAYVRMGQYEEAVPICKTVLQRQPDQLSVHIFLTISYTTQRKSMGLDWWGFGEPKEGGQRRTKNRHSHCDRSMQRISILPC